MNEFKVQAKNLLLVKDKKNRISVAILNSRQNMILLISNEKCEVEPMEEVQFTTQDGLCDSVYGYAVKYSSQRVACPIILKQEDGQEVEQIDAVVSYLNQGMTKEAVKQSRYLRKFFGCEFNQEDSENGFNNDNRNRVLDRSQVFHMLWELGNGAIYPTERITRDEKIDMVNTADFCL